LFWMLHELRSNFPQGIHGSGSPQPAAQCGLHVPCSCRTFCISAFCSSAHCVLAAYDASAEQGAGI
jgi:hypothetical protein